MNKNDVLEIGKELEELKTKKATEDLIKLHTELVEKVLEKLELNEKAKIGEVTYEKCLQKGKSGKLNGVDYITEDKVVIRVKASSRLKLVQGV